MRNSKLRKQDMKGKKGPRPNRIHGDQHPNLPLLQRDGLDPEPGRTSALGWQSTFE